jgi:nitrate/TMAO reductase-like tetraheme cytochrome c subunit
MRSFFVTLTRSPISLLGMALALASGLLVVILLVLELLGFHGSPYLGILAFVILPALFVFGLLLVPVGLVRQRRRERKAREGGGEEPSFPVVDLNQPRTRRTLLILLAATVVNLVIVAVASFKAVEVMDSTAFCGTTCHTVMAPEYTTYQRSPHARVKCVACHIGPGAGWFVKSKLSGSWQLVSVALDLYPRPIPTPVHNLRPARETCEQCHWPSKFLGDQLKVITHFGNDEANTEAKTVLLMRVGGIQGRVSQGIHWHVDPALRIRYRANESRELIGDVELTLPDGSVKLYRSETVDELLAEEGGPAEGWRTMDCVDCHNRPTHIYRLPHEEVDGALAEGELDRTLPYLRKEGMRVLQEEFASHEEARESIREEITRFYRESYPELAASRAADIEAAAETLGRIYTTNVFPSMNITWGTYANQIGHENAPGCFRCHDEEHVTEEGEAISQDCETCHSLLAMEEEDPEVLEILNP